MNWIAWLIVGLGSFALLYAVVCVVLAQLFTGTDHSWTWPLRATPADAGLEYEDVSFVASDGLQISGWWLPASNNTAVVMIPGGGLNRLNDHTYKNAKEVKTDTLELARTFVARGHGVLMYDPRGTGGSGGRGLSFGSLEFRDFIGALDWLALRGVQADHVAVLAWSMGCATAMFALEKRTYAVLIADSPLGGFSVDDVVRHVSALLRLPTALARPLTVLFMNGVFVIARLLWGMQLWRKPAGELRKHAIPTLVIHGRADRTIPLRVAEQVAGAAGKQLVGAHYLDGVDHCQAYESDRQWYIDTVSSALDLMLPNAKTVTAVSSHS